MIKECLTKNEIITSFIIRKKVFIEEEKISYEDEFDLLDSSYRNFLIYYKNKAVGTARFEVNGKTAHIGRLCVLKEYRHLGLASQLILYLIEEIKKTSAKKIILGAQLSVLGFYEQLNFIPYGKVFLDAGIKHKMVMMMI